MQLRVGGRTPSPMECWFSRSVRNGYIPQGHVKTPSAERREQGGRFLASSHHLLCHASCLYSAFPIPSSLVPGTSFPSWSPFLSWHTFQDKIRKRGASLVIQWLRLHAPNAGAWFWCLVRELRSHMWSGTAKNFVFKKHCKTPGERKDRTHSQNKE